MIDIKIGREVVTFTEEDVFIDNGVCIQCNTKKGRYRGYGSYCILQLTKKAVKELEAKCDRVNVVQKPHSVQYFRYKLKEEV